MAWGVCTGVRGYLLFLGQHREGVCALKSHTWLLFPLLLRWHKKQHTLVRGESGTPWMRARPSCSCAPEKTAFLGTRLTVSSCSVCSHPTSLSCFHGITRLLSTRRADPRTNIRRETREYLRSNRTVPWYGAHDTHAAYTEPLPITTTTSTACLLQQLVAAAASSASPSVEAESTFPAICSRSTPRARS